MQDGGKSWGLMLALFKSERMDWMPVVVPIQHKGSKYQEVRVTRVMVGGRGFEGQRVQVPKLGVLCTKKL